MGLKSAKSLTFNIKKLNIRAIKDTIKTIRNPADLSFFKIDVDCNWVAFKLGCGKKPQEAASKTADFIQCLSSCGFIVTPICDGERRHHSKRASIERVAKYEKDRTMASITRLQLLATSTQLREETNLNTEEREELKNRQKELNKLVGKLEAKVENTGLYRSFASDLEAELEIRDAFSDQMSHHGKVQPVKVGLYQADALIAKRAIDGLSHMIFGADTDFFVSIGPSCILIKDFFFKRPAGRQKKQIELMELNNIQLACSSIEMRNRIENALDENMKNEAIFENATYPLLDTDTIRLRSIIAIIIGCDVFVGGVDKVGVAKISRKLTDLREQHGDDDAEIIDELRQWVMHEDMWK